MIIQPSKEVTEDLATKISEAREGKKGSFLDQPKVAAEHLRTKEELNMFYGESHEAEWPLAVIAITKGVVAAGAIIAATLLAGPSPQLSSELDNLTLKGADNLDVNDLLEIRRSVI